MTTTATPPARGGLTPRTPAHTKARTAPAKAASHKASLHKTRDTQTPAPLTPTPQARAPQARAPQASARAATHKANLDPARSDDPVAPAPHPVSEPRRAAALRDTGFDITAAPRALLRESIRLIYSVLGEERLGSAQANAWASVCADRERARNRAEIARLLTQSRTRSRLP